MKDVNNVSITSTLASNSMANLENPSANVYANWTNNGVRNAPGYMAANTKIDLRGFAMPTPSRKVNSPFGQRWGRLHAGLDIKVYVGDTISAAFDGKVRVVDYNANGYGYYVVIRHANGLETLYGHMSKQLVKPNQIVRAGEPIGLGGNTGRSFGSHLHFETRICGTPVNPALMFDFPNQDVTGDYFITNTAYGTAGAVASTTSHMQAAQDATVATAQPVASVAIVTETPVEPARVATPARVSSSRASASSRTKASASTYTVRSGDNLYSIARRYGTTVDKICKANGISANAPIRAGQRIKL